MKSNDVTFERIEDLASTVVHIVKSNTWAFVSVVGKFDNIRDTICALMKYEVTFDGLSVCSPEYDKYEDEYVLDIWNNDGEIHIGCEPTKRDGEYLNMSGDVVYIFDDSNSKLLGNCKYDKTYFVSIGDDVFDCVNCYCDECSEICDRKHDEPLADANSYVILRTFRI